METEAVVVVKHEYYASQYLRDIMPHWTALPATITTKLLLFFISWLRRQHKSNLFRPFVSTFIRCNTAYNDLKIVKEISLGLAYVTISDDI